MDLIKFRDIDSHVFSNYIPTELVNPEKLRMDVTRPLLRNTWLVDNNCHVIVIELLQGAGGYTVRAL